MPYLSVVAASRNDDHGGDPLTRTQIFISNFARQCEKYRVPAELILVDWNPVPGRPGLAGVLQLPAEASFCSARIITVPAVLHERFKYGDRVQFFQMIAKNVAIRRGRGRFVLATNIDIIFSDELMQFIGRQQLDPAKLYRVDRYDIQPGLSANLSLEETLDYAWNHPVRSNRREEPRKLVQHLYGEELFKRHCEPDPKVCAKHKEVAVTMDGEVWSVRPERNSTLAKLHTNACGDFTLLSREGWDAITGYPEFEAFSFHIDSFGLAAGHYAGFGEVALLPPCVCFHIEHSLGSGWTPEGEKKLFDRLNEKEILNPEWHVLLPMVEAMRAGKQPTALNGPGWGLAEFNLPEAPLLSGEIAPTAVEPRPFPTPNHLAVSALLPAFDLDRVTLWQERRLNPTERFTQTIAQIRADLKKAEDYLKIVDKDRDDLLASILLYQEKLKVAYADHDRNVAYIKQLEGNVPYLKQLEAEIAALKRVGAEKDVRIADLTAQSQVAGPAHP